MDPSLNRIIEVGKHAPGATPKPTLYYKKSQVLLYMEWKETLDHPHATEYRTIVEEEARLARRMVKRRLDQATLSSAKQHAPYARENGLDQQTYISKDMYTDTNKHTSARSHHGTRTKRNISYTQE